MLIYHFDGDGGGDDGDDGGDDGGDDDGDDHRNRILKAARTWEP